MARTDRVDRSGRSRRRRVLARAAAVAATALAVVGWLTGDGVSRVLLPVVAAAVVVVVVRRRRREPSDVERYSEALHEASGMRVELRGARVLAVHTSRTPTLVAVSWRGARTTLLDADGRPLAALDDNGLTSAYTLGIPVRDLGAVDALTHEPGLGTVVVHGTTDLFAHPDGSVAENGLVLDQYDLAFPSWHGSLPVHRFPSYWD